MRRHQLHRANRARPGSVCGGVHIIGQMYRTVSPPRRLLPPTARYLRRRQRSSPVFERRQGRRSAERRPSRRAWDVLAVSATNATLPCVVQPPTVCRPTALRPPVLAVSGVGSPWGDSFMTASRALELRQIGVWWTVAMAAKRIESGRTARHRQSTVVDDRFDIA